MNKEQLIAKKVKHQFNGKETLFSVDSLNQHFDGLQIHESDILTDEFEGKDGGYVKVSDVIFDFADPNEVEDNTELKKEYLILEGENEVTQEMLDVYPGIKDSGFEVGDVLVNDLDKPFYKKGYDTKQDGMSFQEAEKELDLGNLISLPEWEGFWFKDLINGQLLVFTKDNEILDTPHEEYKLRNDWTIVEATPEQESILRNYFDNPEIDENDPYFWSQDDEDEKHTIPQGETVITSEILEKYPALKEAMFKIGDVMVTEVSDADVPAYRIKNITKTGMSLEEEKLTIQPEDPAFGTGGIVLNKTPEMRDEEIKNLNKGLVLEPNTIVNEINVAESSFETLSDGPETPEPPQEEIGLPKPREPKKSKTSKK